MSIFAQNCTFVHICVHLLLNLVNSVCANITLLNIMSTFAPDFQKRCLRI